MDVTGPGEPVPAVPDSAGAGPPGGVLVIGIGNDLRADDGVGLAVVEELARHDRPGLDAVWSHQLVPELAEPISRAARVVFVDAAVPGADDPAPGPAGQAGAPDVQVRRLTPSAPALGGHQSGPGALLGLAALAGLPVPEAFLVSVRARDLGLGEELSAPARTAVDVAVRAVLRLAASDRPDGA